MLVKVHMENILEFTRNGQDCKMEISADGTAYFMPINAAGYRDTILIQEYLAYDYEDCENEEQYKEWLADCYYGAPMEAKNGELVKIEFIK